MTKDEILKVVNRKGAVVREMFKSSFDTVMQHVENHEHLMYDGRYLDEDTIATFCYNATILLTNIVLDNPTFFEYYGVYERNRNRAQKDLETMHRLEYDDDFDEDEMEYLENDFVYPCDPNSEY